MNDNNHFNIEMLDTVIVKIKRAFFRPHYVLPDRISLSYLNVHRYSNSQKIQHVEGGLFSPAVDPPLTGSYINRPKSLSVLLSDSLLRASMFPVKAGSGVAVPAVAVQGALSQTLLTKLSFIQAIHERH